jgi:Mrp family chromosome partitioning ATPase
MRIVAHDPADPRSRSFDLLRTQILQDMDANGWRILAVTSPTPACGKTFTALNLALSIARQPETSVLLVDLDVKKPQLAQRLGLSANAGVRAVLERRASLEEATLQVSASGARFRFLPCERPSSRASDWLASSATAAMLQSMRADRSLKLVILDLPPMLAGDEVVSILPHVDCVLMVAALGTTTTAELKECANFMRATPLIRVVLNKVPEVPAGHYY